MNDFAKFIEFLAAYPFWVRVLFVAWLALSAILMASLLLSGKVAAAAALCPYGWLPLPS